MTVSSAIATATFNWTGAETGFTPGFQAVQPGDVSVTFTASGAGAQPQALTYNTAYSVVLDSANNVTVVPIALPPPPGTLTIQRNSTPLQIDHFQDGVPWAASVIEQALDLLALRDQELRRDLTALVSAIAAETVRAQSAEAADAALIATETARAKAAETSLWGAITPVLALTTAVLTNWLDGSYGALPTTEPAGAGAFWNNGGVVCVTAGGANPLPTTLPAASGVFWNNGGVLCIS